MYWMNPNSSIPCDDEALGGEEYFILHGSLELNGGNYSKWGWMRFPPGGTEVRANLRAGADGAQIYRKTGHLTDKALSMEKIQITDD
jgi:hypothetical protein